jgi:hypothetical protein
MGRAERVQLLGRKFDGVTIWRRLGDLSARPPCRMRAQIVPNGRHASDRRDLIVNDVTFEARHQTMSENPAGFDRYAW